MRKLISHMFTRHDNMKACSQWNTRTVCNTTKHTWTGERAVTQRQKMERECPNPDKKTKLKTWVPGSKHHAPTRNKVRRRESRALTWKQDMTGVSGLCHKTMNNTRPKWQNPDNFTVDPKQKFDHSLIWLWVLVSTVYNTHLYSHAWQ